MPKAKGFTCDVDMECDGAGVCVQKPCGNGRLDPGEQCDKNDSTWRGTCGADCKLTKAIFKQCQWQAGECAGDWFCSSVGMCAHLCSLPSDCPAGSACKPVAGGNSACVWECGGTGNRGCPDNATCQWYGQEGVVSAPAYMTCGWISSDPTNGNAPWCPKEYNPTGCCPPHGGGMCTVHP